MIGAATFRLALSPSRQFAAVIVLLHAVAAACFLTILQALPAFLLAGLLVALGVASARDRALLRGPSAPSALELRTDGSADCILADGRRQPVQGGATAGRWVAIRLGGGTRRSLLVTEGMVEPESFRLLRLWALWGKLPPAALRRRAA